MLKVCKLSSDAQVPTRGDSEAAGYDLYCISDLYIEPWSRQLVSTGISLEIPSGFYGRIASRSSLGVKGFDVGAGVIDSSYRGEIKVVFINSSSESKKLSKGDRIAQIIFEKYYTFELTEVTELSSSQRGTYGFGSTGF